METTVHIPAQCKLGEGPFWSNNAWWWVDIERGQFHRWSRAQGAAHCELGQRVGMVVPLASHPERFVAGLENGLAWLSWPDGKIEFFANPEEDKPNNRFNDGKCDPRGRLFAGTMSMKGEKGAGSLYRIDPDLSVTRVISDVTISNGLAWNRAADTFYYIDTPSSEIKAFAYDIESGELGELIQAIPFPKEWGHPDGMTIDDEDRLWVACWGGASVRIIDPRSGESVGRVPVAAPNVTCCAFGGPSRSELLITTAGVGSDEEKRKQYPDAGNVFHLHAPVAGPAAYPFAGED